MPIPYPSVNKGRHLKEGRIVAISRSPEETREIGRALGAHAKPGHVILLNGTLGTGKTCLAQGVLWGLGAEEYARSPTFVLVSQYMGRLTMYHIDLFRLDFPEEVHDLGIDEYLYGDGLSVVEWADKAPGLLPEDSLMIQIEHVDDTSRRLTLSTSAEGYAEAMSAVKSMVTSE